MARVSFRLRRDTSIGGDVVGVGSYSRSSAEAQALAGASSIDNDRTLRSKDFVIAFINNAESTFSASASDYNETLINWAISEPVTPYENVLINESALVGIRVVYSTYGYPESANDGTIVYDEMAQGDDSLNISNLSIDHYSGDSKPWRYYSLFGRYYQNDSGVSGTYWYEKLASLEVLMPYNYGSTDNFWNRIPMHYREQDTTGDLYKFISIFGFELDRTRTLIDAVMTSSDPLLAEAETIEQLANFVGLEVNVPDIGVQRTRALLHDIGYLRKQKGTYSGIVGYLKALSGANVDFELVAGQYVATIYAQRANLIGNPRFTNVANYSVIAQTGSVTTTPIANGITIAAGATGTKVAIVSKVAVPVKTGVPYYMSFNWASTGTTSTVYGGYISNTNTWATWTGLTAQGEISVSGLDYVDAGTGLNRRVFNMGPSIVTGATKYFVLVLDIPANATVTLKNWMVEPNSFGPYFDGSSDFGGFLYQSNFNDYQWSGAPSVNNSYSTFTTQRAKLEKAIKKVCASIMPVNLTFNPEDPTHLRFDWIPGKT
jgi:phage tail-like protein